MRLKKVNLAMVERLDEFYSIPYRAYLDNGVSVNGVISSRRVAKNGFNMRTNGARRFLI